MRIDWSEGSFALPVNHRQTSEGKQRSARMPFLVRRFAALAVTRATQLQVCAVNLESKASV
jgi:hypothetical protein